MPALLTAAPSPASAHGEISQNYTSQRAASVSVPVDIFGKSMRAGFADHADKGP
jgi:hypothetical protein